jgi:hypothetical protein
MSGRRFGLNKETLGAGASVWTTLGHMTASRDPVAPTPHWNSLYGKRWTGLGTGLEVKLHLDAGQLDHVMVIQAVRLGV